VEVLVSRIDYVVRVVILSKIKGHRRARVYKHSVAIAAEKKRNWLVHILVLRAHAIASPNIDVLPTLVETRERFAAAKDLLVVLQQKRRGNSSIQVRRTTNERERNRSDERCRVAHILGSSQEMSCLVVELDVPWRPDNPHFSIRALVTYCLIVLLDSPGVVGWHWASKHQRGSVTHRDSPGRQAESNSARTNESD